MILPSVYQLSIIGVVDAGIANHERIVMRPAEAVNLAQFGLFLARKGANELVTPLTDNFFWFGEFIAEPPSWLIVYTGPGEFQTTKLPGTEQTAYSFHWGKQYTVFNDPNIVPVLFFIGGILSGKQLITIPDNQKHLT